MKLKFIKKQTVLKNILFTNAHIQYSIRRDIRTSIIYLESKIKLDAVGIELLKSKDSTKKLKGFLDINLLDYIDNEYDYSEYNSYIYKIKFNSIINIVSISIKNNINTSHVNNIPDIYLEYDENKPKVFNEHDISLKDEKRLTKSMTAILYSSESKDYHNEDYHSEDYYIPNKMDNSDIEILSTNVQFMNNKIRTLSEDLYTYNIIDPVYQDEPYKIRLKFKPALKNVNKINILFKNKNIYEIDEYCNYIEYIKVL
jgi:hypothetical protein